MIFVCLFMCIGMLSSVVFGQDEVEDAATVYSCRLKDFNVKLTYDKKRVSSSVLRLEYTEDRVDTFSYHSFSKQFNRHEMMCERTGNLATISTTKAGDGIVELTLSLKGKEMNLTLDEIPMDTSLDVFIYDKIGSDTNVRNAPKGKVVGKLPTAVDYMLNICDVRDGWWRICSNEVYSFDVPEGPVAAGSEGVAWIHYSVLGSSTRNYGGETIYLRETPSEKARATFSFSEEMILRPLEIKDSWVKVETTDKKHRGWIDGYWLCGNAVTTCP